MRGQSLAKELLIPLLIIGVLGSVLLPVAPFILDILIVCNLVLAVGLLITALQITDPLKLSALPTILLLCTLYRLCLNISTTRLILGAGQGGRVVETFGTFVVGGSLGVGCIVFIILTFIQFIVVAKGSERVAEVAARFTLDAMPGKQMSVDADVRAGLYDIHAARIKRQELQTESRFYGALDGAMKFVKGDSIAGIFIVAVNIFGGFCIGIYNGLSFQQALHTYTLLTVGDGLSSQIPSLLNSLAAGLVVTRVGNGASHSLSEELFQQLLQSRQVMVLAGSFSFVLGFVPGMPPLPLLIVGLLLLGGAVIRGRKEARQGPLQENPVFHPSAIPLLHITVGKGLSLSGIECRSLAEDIRREFFEKTGILIGYFEVIEEETRSTTSIILRGVAIPPFQINNREDLLPTIVKSLTERRLEFLDDNHSRRILDTYESQVPELVSHVVPHVVTLTQLTEILKGLARESVSIRHCDLILQAISETAQKAGNERILLEEARIALSRIISSSVADDLFVIHCATVAPQLDLQLSESERSQQPLSGRVVRHLTATLSAAGEKIRCVVVSRAARRKLAEMLHAYEMKLPVLSYNELSKDFTIQSCCEVQGLDEECEYGIPLAA